MKRRCFVLKQNVTKSFKINNIFSPGIWISTVDENNYIKQLHAGAEEGFRRIFERYHDRLCYFAALHLTSEELPEDVVQEAFIKLWQKRRHFSNMHSVKSFLYVVVRNHCLDICKHRKVKQKYAHYRNINAELEKDLSIHPTHDILEAEVVDKVFKALEKLPKGCRNVMFLSYFQGLKNNEIAEELQVSVNTVKTQKQRGLQLLRKTLSIPYLWILFFFC